LNKGYILKISFVTLWDWTKKDVLPADRIGYKVRYKKSEALESLKKINRFKIVSCNEN
jgi:hypothetical protein